MDPSTNVIIDLKWFAFSLVKQHCFDLISFWILLRNCFHSYIIFLYGNSTEKSFNVRSNVGCQSYRFSIFHIVSSLENIEFDFLFKRKYSYTYNNIFQTNKSNIKYIVNWLVKDSYQSTHIWTFSNSEKILFWMIYYSMQSDATTGKTHIWLEFFFEI